MLIASNAETARPAASLSQHAKGNKTAFDLLPPVIEGLSMESPGM
jgi:hypothetical protein